MTNKHVLVIKLIAYIALFALMCGFAVSLFFNYRFSFRMDGIFNYSLNLTKSETFSNIDKVQSELISFDVEVEEWDEDNVAVDCYGLIDERLDMSTNGKTLIITQRKNSMPFFSFGVGKIVVKVPKDSRFDYDLHTISGSIKCSAPVDSIDANSTSGSIKLYENGNSAAAKTISGSIEMYAPFNKIYCHTTSGSIKITIDNDTDNAKLSSVSGSVKIAKPHKLGYLMSYSTVSGSVKDEYNSDSFSKNGDTRFGSGEVDISVTTVSGSIKLTDWD